MNARIRLEADSSKKKRLYAGFWRDWPQFAVIARLAWAFLVAAVALIAWQAGGIAALLQNFGDPLYFLYADDYTVLALIVGLAAATMAGMFAFMCFNYTTCVPFDGHDETVEISDGMFRHMVDGQVVLAADLSKVRFWHDRPRRHTILWGAGEAVHDGGGSGQLHAPQRTRAL